MAQNKSTAKKKAPLVQTSLKGDTLTFVNGYHVGKVDLTTLHLAYVCMEDKQGYLLLGDKPGRHFVVLDKDVLENIYPVLSKRFGFDDTVFYETLAQTKDQRKPIWFKIFQPNYQVLDGNFDDITKGFEVIGDKTTFVLWDASYKEILNSTYGVSYKASNKQTYFKFTSKVRIGNLLVENLEFCVNKERLDMAVENYFVDVYNKQNNVGSYYDLEAVFKKSSGNKEPIETWKTDTREYTKYAISDIEFSFIYDFEGETSTEDRHTYLMINNKRDYTGVVLQEAPFSDLEHITIIPLEENLSFYPDYKDTQGVYLSPKAIKDKANCTNAIWVDTQNNTIGFIAGQYCYFCDISDIKNLVIQDVLPGKNPGFSYTRISFHNRSIQTLYQGDLYCFNDLLNKQEQLHGVLVEVRTPMVNS
ncbi:hypothetical protein ACYSNX_01125 [Myroides sp. LJL115]